jgi:hypothetical protein
MQELLVSALRAQRPHVRAHWEALLRVEPVGSPLGHPDALVHLIDWTLDEIFTTLANPLARHRSGHNRLNPDEQPQCPCGRNPLLAYFAACEQSMHEALILAQAATANLDPLERDASFRELNLVLQQISRREIEAFCGVCQFRDKGDAHPAVAHAEAGHAGDSTPIDGLS